MGFQFFCAQLTEPKQYLVLDVEFDWFWTCERFSTIILRLYCRHSIITLVGSCSQNSHVSIDWGSHFRLTLLAVPTDSDMCFLHVSCQKTSMTVLSQLTLVFVQMLVSVVNNGLQRVRVCSSPSPCTLQVCSMAKITPFAMYAICADSVHGKRRDLCHATHL